MRESNWRKIVCLYVSDEKENKRETERGGGQPSVMSTSVSRNQNCLGVY